MNEIPDNYAYARPVFAQARSCLSNQENALSNLWHYEEDARNGVLSAPELRGYLHGLFAAGLLGAEDYEEMVTVLVREIRRAERAAGDCA